MRPHLNRLLRGGFGSRGIGFRFIVSKAQLLHDHLLRLLRRTAEQLLFRQLQLLQQPLILQCQAGNDLCLLLKSLIFCTGNGYHFFRVACLHFSVFHANIIPQNAAKSQCFQ